MAVVMKIRHAVSAGSVNRRRTVKGRNCLLLFLGEKKVAASLVISLIKKSCIKKEESLFFFGACNLCSEGH